MKIRLLVPAVIAAALTLASLAFAKPKAEFVNADAPDNADIRNLGERAINRLAYSMVTEVSSAMTNKGESQALAVCHLKNVSATGAVIADMPRVTAWKRTSLKLRDPANAPDAADLLALNHVQSALTSGNVPPKILVQRIDHGSSPAEWRVYKSVGVLKQCLGCHGPADGIAPDVRAELARRYPSDGATGYQQGEWRGLLRVTIGPPPPPPPPAPAKASAPKKR